MDKVGADAQGLVQHQLPKRRHQPKTTQQPLSGPEHDVKRLTWRRVADSARTERLYAPPNTRSILWHSDTVFGPARELTSRSERRCSISWHSATIFWHSHSSGIAPDRHDGAKDTAYPQGPSDDHGDLCNRHRPVTPASRKTSATRPLVRHTVECNYNFDTERIDNRAPDSATTPSLVTVRRPSAHVPLRPSNTAERTRFHDWGDKKNGDNTHVRTTSTPSGGTRCHHLPSASARCHECHQGLPSDRPGLQHSRSLEHDHQHRAPTLQHSRGALLHLPHVDDSSAIHEYRKSTQQRRLDRSPAARHADIALQTRQDDRHHRHVLSTHSFATTTARSPTQRHADVDAISIRCREKEACSTNRQSFAENKPMRPCLTERCTAEHGAPGRTNRYPPVVFSPYYESNAIRIPERRGRPPGRGDENHCGVTPPPPCHSLALVQRTDSTTLPTSDIHIPIDGATLELWRNTAQHCHGLGRQRHRLPLDSRPTFRSQMTRFNALAVKHHRTVTQPRDIWGLTIPAELPLQSVDVPAMNLSGLCQRFDDIVEFQQASAILEHICVKPQFTTTHWHRRHDELLEAVNLCTDNGILVPAAPPAVGDGIVLAHTVPEKLGTTKARRRLVADTLSANLSTDPPTVTFTPIRAVLQKLADANCTAAGMRNIHFWSTDLKSSFFQVPLPHKVRDAFKIRCGDSFFTFARLPMGFTRAVDVMHAITTGLLKASLQQAHLCWDDFILIDIYVDNIIVAAYSAAALRTLEMTFFDICQKFAVTIGESSIATTTTHRGVALATLPDSHITFELKHSFRTKLHAHIAFCLATPTPITVRHLETVIGEIVYADDILRAHHVRGLFHAYGSWRALATAKTKRFQPAPAVKAELQLCLQWLYNTSHLANITTPQHATHCFSDASRQWLAAITMQHQSIFVQRQPTPQLPNEPFNISPLELEAAIMAIRHAQQTAAERVLVRLFSDNVATLRTLSRRYSSSIRMYSVLKSAVLTGGDVIPCFIPGVVNPADGPSRHLRLDSTKIVSDLIHAHSALRNSTH